MSETARIVDQLRRSYAGPAWHGPALVELLTGLTGEEAMRRPLPHAHTICEIVGHVSTWQMIAARAIQGQAVPDLPFPDNWRTADACESDWPEMLEILGRTNAELCAAAEALTDERLHDAVPGHDYSYYFLLHGVAQHNLYHAGQIAILKKR